MYQFPECAENYNKSIRITKGILKLYTIESNKDIFLSPTGAIRTTVTDVKENIVSQILSDAMFCWEARKKSGKREVHTSTF